MAGRHHQELQPPASQDAPNLHACTALHSVSANCDTSPLRPLSLQMAKLGAQTCSDVDEECAVDW